VTQDPYKSAENRAFWSRSVARDFVPASTVDTTSVRLGRDDRFMSAGSCFASNVRRYLESWGYDYTVTEEVNPQWPESAETLYYEAFSARYGNVYTARQMVQLLERSLGTFHPSEECWETPDGEFIDPYRPGLSHRAWSSAEFRALTAQHLAAVKTAVERSTVLVFTLGLTEAWYSADDGAVFPACPGTVSGEFDPDRHKFVNFTADEVTGDLERMVEILRSINPGIRVVLTVSPVPLVATASGRHVLTATTYSKSVLRVAADQASRSSTDVVYFPAYELVLGSQNTSSPFDSDLRTVREPVISSVMSGFAATLLGETTGPAVVATRPTSAGVRSLIEEAVEAECEEMMADDQLSRPDQGDHPGPDRAAGSFLGRLRSGRTRS
jgi:GSCFA family